MIRHIVSWRLAATDAGERAVHAAEVKKRLEGLAGTVPAESLFVGIDLGDTEGNWHVVLDSVFASAEDLAAYQVHPAHVEAAGYVKSVVEARSCVDFAF